MSTTATIRGTSHTIPATGETGYGAAVMAFLGSLRTSVLMSFPFGNDEMTASGTTYASPVRRPIASSATEHGITVPVQGSLRSIWVFEETGASGVPDDPFGLGNSVIARYTVRVNGFDVALTCNRNNNQDNAQTSGTGDVPVAAGDVVSVSYAPVGVINSPAENSQVLILLSME